VRTGPYTAVRVSYASTHQSTLIRASWAFGCMRRRERFGLFPSGLPGFTRRLRMKVQNDLGVLRPRVAPEIHVLLPSPSRSGLRPPFPAWPICCSAFRLWSASIALPTTWPTTPSADFCLAVRLPLGRLSRSRDTRQISWGKLSRLPCTVAGSTLRILDGYGLRSTLPARPTLAPYIRFLSIDSHVCFTLPPDPASRR
jgi:hypothetical protein